MERIICERETARRLNTKEHVHVGVFFFSLFFHLAIFQRGNHQWEPIYTGCLRGKKALYRLDPPSKTLQDFLLLSPEEYLQVQEVTAGPLEAFNRRSLHPREWWPHRRSTQLFLNVWRFSQPSILTCDRERHGLQHPPTPILMEIGASVQMLKTGTEALLIFISLLSTPISLIRENA